jgi:hypothetical protein
LVGSIYIAVSNDPPGLFLDIGSILLVASASSSSSYSSTSSSSALLV